MKLKHYLFLLTVFTLLIAGCDHLEPKDPEFITMQKVRVTNISAGNVTIEGDAVLRNPNAVGLDLTGIDIDVTVNEVEVGKARQTNSAVDIQANSNFTIPLAFDFKTKQVLGDVILGVLGALIKQKVDVLYKGNIKFKALDLNLEFEVPIEYEEEIPLKEEK